MRFLCLLACLMGTCLLLSGCTSATENGDFLYANSAFSVAVEGTLTRRTPDGYEGAPSLTGDPLTGVAQPLSAVIAVGAPGAGGERELTVTFTAPPSLAGLAASLVYTTDDAGAPAPVVTLTRPGASGTVTLHDRTAPGAYDGYLRFATILLPVGDIVTVTPTDNGRHTVTRRTPDGEETLTYTFEEGASLPIAVCAETPAEQIRLALRPIG